MGALMKNAAHNAKPRPQCEWLGNVPDATLAALLRCALAAPVSVTGLFCPRLVHMRAVRVSSPLQVVARIALAIACFNRVEHQKSYGHGSRPASGHLCLCC